MFSASVEVLLHIAFREAISRRHAYLTLEHLLYALLHDADGERILGACGADLGALRRSLSAYLTESIEQVARGQEYEPEQTAAFRRVLQTAVMHVQSAQREDVQAGDLLAAILQQPKTRAAILLAEQGVTRLDVLEYISHGISKTPVPTPPGAAPRTGAGVGGEDQSSTAPDPLSAYCLNLTDRASRGLLDPLIGRTDELQRTIEVLCRRRKNNPVFVGDAGVGKTAMAEGLAARLLADDVRDAIPTLKGAEVFALDTGALLAGTRFRGDFEERFKAVIAALVARPKAILFIDEIHSTVGAGAVTGGTMDLATLLKPLLTAGDLRVIGSTTFEEFKHIEKDRGLARRLQKIAIDEPSIEETVRILAGLRDRYETYHQVTYTDAALDAAVKLAARHLRDYRLPDSAIDLIDEAGAVTRLKTPIRQKPSLDSARDGPELVEAPDATDGRDAAMGHAAETRADWPAVDAPDIEPIVARMARIPARQATSSDRERLRTLEESLERVVFGQHEAVHLVAQAIKRSRAGMGQPERPAGCFLFTGPTGVGKTELAKQLAILLGNEFIRFDMSEYMEKHAVARLIGAPPGYVGYEQGGQLVDAVRTHPYSVVLLDEIEKAHHDVYNILLQVMDHATLTDNTGRKADFRNVVLILTSNAGSREMSATAIGFSGRGTTPSRGPGRPDRTVPVDDVNDGNDVRSVDGVPGFEEDTSWRTAASKAKAAVERVFSPEFRNRLDAIVIFRPLTPAAMETIVEKFVMQLEGQLAERHVAIALTPEARVWLAATGYDPVFGARPLGRVIQKEVRDPLTDEILFGRLEHGGTAMIDVKDDCLTFAYEPRQP